MTALEIEHRYMTSLESCYDGKKLGQLRDILLKKPRIKRKFICSVCGGKIKLKGDTWYHWRTSFLGIVLDVCSQKCHDELYSFVDRILGDEVLSDKREERKRKLIAKLDRQEEKNILNFQKQLTEVLASEENVGVGLACWAMSNGEQDADMLIISTRLNKERITLLRNFLLERFKIQSSVKRECETNYILLTPSGTRKFHKISDRWWKGKNTARLVYRTIDKLEKIGIV